MNLSVEALKTFSSSKSLNEYAQIVGVRETRYPSLHEFPQTLYLEPRLLGDFKKNILLTTKDGLERAELIYDTSGDISTRQFIMGKKNIIIPSQGVYFGKKPLFFYHTHFPFSEKERHKYGVDKGDESKFSVTDVFNYIENPRLGFIYGVGSKEGATFLLQTKKSAGIPFSSFLRWNINTAKAVVDAFLSRQKYIFAPPLSGPSSPYEKWGLAVYIWRPRPQEFDQAQLTSGIFLKLLNSVT
ncbi:MAG: hypothetical protein UY49_C0024G0004 [Microgenomates group bacterium GW2011_GWC1_49_7]|nr:MAG: hypothetical protein UY49_C0024G0004 [Microgenomates group bacterium GW2011_GWC1_49_7]